MSGRIFFLLAIIFITSNCVAQPECIPTAGLEPLDTWQTISGSYASGGWVIYEVTMDLGVYYTFKTGCGDGASADHNTIIEWMTPICTVIDQNDDGCENGTSNLSFQNGIFGDGTVLWIRVRGGLGDGGSYTMAYRSIGGASGNCNECPSYDDQLQPTAIWQNVSSAYEQGCTVYRVNMTAGLQYTFKTGCGDGATSDHDTVLELSDGGWPVCNTISSDDDGCEEGRSQIIFTSAVSGFRYLKVRSANGDGGSFTLAYRSSGGNGTLCSGCPSQDLTVTPNFNWYAHSSGHLADGCQIYRVMITEGWLYTFKTGCGNGAGADYDTRLELYDASCELIASDDDGCEGSLSIIEHVATTTGPMYLKVTGADGAGGSYTLAMRRTGTCVHCPDHDHAIVPTTDWQTSTSGHGLEGCQVYQVSVEQGHTYVFQTACGEGASSSYSTALQLMDADCLSLGSNSYACEWPGARLFHTASYTGMVYLKVYGTSGEFGSFTLAYREMGPAQDDCNAVETVSLGYEESVTFTGNAQDATSDNDFVAGSPYQGTAVLWHSFQVNDCIDVIVSYCGQEDSWPNTLGFLALDCPADSVVHAAPESWICDNGNTHYLYTNLNPGTYLLPVTYDPLNEGEGEYEVTVSVAWCFTVGIPSSEQQNWTIHPNPGQGGFTLFNGTAMEIRSVDLLDISGRLIQSHVQPIAPSARKEIQAAGLPPGIYVVRATTSDQKRLDQRWVVQ